MLTPNRKTALPVERSAEILGGVLVFSGTRVPFQTFIDYLKAGDPLDDFLDDFPTVKREQVFSVLEAAQEALMQSHATLVG
jgi:uncharacterized protein (DUF433 family)